MFKRNVIAIDREDEIELAELQGLQKRNGRGRFSFRMGLDVDPLSGYNNISKTGKSNFEYLLTTLSSNDLHWVLSTTLKEVARDKELAQAEAKAEMREELDPQHKTVETKLNPVNEKLS